MVLREVAGGWTFATRPDTEDAARRLLAKPRTPPLTPAQAETLAIVAYLQPVSRPEIARIRGVSADSAARHAARARADRGDRALAVRRRRCTARRRCSSSSSACTSLDDLPDVARWDPSPEEEADLRERLFKAGEARAGSPVQGDEPAPVVG